MTSPFLNISNLHLDAPSLRISSIEVTQSISTTTPGSYITAFGPQNWTFHSIDVNNVMLAPSQETRLVYVPSEPRKGLKLVGSGWGFSLPRFAVHWYPGIPPLLNSSVYPLTELPGTHTVGASFDLEPQPGQLDYRFEGIFTSSKLLSFRVIQLRYLCDVVIEGFACSPDGELFAESINSTSLIVPSGVGELSVHGHLTIGSSIVFAGTDSNLVVGGCVQVGGEVILDLSKEKALPQVPVTLITQSPSCTNSLSDVELNVRLPPQKGCERTKFERQGSAQMTVLFRIDKSGCNTKWIIIGAVLGSVALVLVILAAIFTLHKPARNCLGLAPRSNMQQVPTKPK